MDRMFHVLVLGGLALVSCGGRVVGPPPREKDAEPVGSALSEVDAAIAFQPATGADAAVDATLPIVAVPGER